MYVVGRGSYSLWDRSRLGGEVDGGFDGPVRTVITGQVVLKDFGIFYDEVFEFGLLGGCHVPSVVNGYFV